MTDSRLRSGIVRQTLAAAFVVITLALLAAGRWYYDEQARAIHQSSYENIAAVARTKVGQIVQWRADRLRDVVREVQSAVFIEALGKIARDGETPETRDQVLKMLERARRGTVYARAIALSPSGQVLLSTGDGPVAIDSSTRHAVAAALADPGGALSDFFRDPVGEVDIDTVGAFRDAGGTPVGLIVLRSRADDFLYPLIQLWPTPSRSAETLLVEQKGEEVVFLNELRHHSGTALSLRNSLTQADVPAVQAVMGRRGVFDGTDYRGVKVLADLCAIPGSPWFMVAKVDSIEIEAETRYRACVISVIVGAFILLAAASTAYAYRRRQAELFRELFESERHQREIQELFRTTLYSIGDGVLTVDAGGRMREMNAVAERLTGWTESEARGKPLEEVFVIVNQETRATVTNPVSIVLRDGAVVGLANHTVLIARDGTERAIADSAAPIRDESGAVSGVVLVFSDVTEQYKMQARLRLQSGALEAAANAIVITDSKGVIQWANAAFAAFTGYSVAEAVGKTPSLLKSGKHDRAFYRALWGVILAGKVWHGEMINRRKDGALYTEEMTITPMKNSRNEVTHFIAVKQDITLRKQMEEKVLRVQRMESIGTLSSGVAHEINNILTPIILSANMLRAVEEADLRECLISSIEKSAQRGADVINQVLAFARGAEGERATLQLTRIVDDIEQITRGTFPRNIAITRSIPSDLWPVKGDATQIHQVLLNLCLNARDAMPNGGALHISVANQEIDENFAAMASDAKAAQYAMLAVSDSGTGIPREIIGQIFDPFFTTKEVGKGTGLGLSTVMGIVRSHGGFVTVDSDEGRGSAFKVFLPRETNGAEEQGQAPPMEVPPGEGETILVVDDEASITEATSITLEKNGYKVLTAEDGAGALALYEEHASEIAIVLTDVMMPGMDGVELARALKQIDPGVKIIASTGQATGTCQAELEALGVNVILRKPYDAGKLLATLHEAICLQLD